VEDSELSNTGRSCTNSVLASNPNYFSQTIPDPNNLASVDSFL